MTKAEYDAKFYVNQKITGFGLNTTLHMPCPFCAEPDFMVYRVIDAEDAMTKGAICKVCGRGAKALVTRTGEGIGFEIVQTVGDPCPDYLPPMRRVDDK